MYIDIRSRETSDRKYLLIVGVCTGSRGREILINSTCRRSDYNKVGYNLRPLRIHNFVNVYSIRTFGDSSFFGQFSLIWENYASEEMSTWGPRHDKFESNFKCVKTTSSNFIFDWGMCDENSNRYMSVKLT